MRLGIERSLRLLWYRCASRRAWLIVILSFSLRRELSGLFRVVFAILNQRYGGCSRSNRRWYDRSKRAFRRLQRLVALIHVYFLSACLQDCFLLLSSNFRCIRPDDTSEPDFTQFSVVERKRNDFFLRLDLTHIHFKHSVASAHSDPTANWNGVDFLQQLGCFAHIF